MSVLLIALNRVWSARTNLTKKAIDSILQKAPPPFAKGVFRDAKTGCPHLSVRLVRTAQDDPTAVRKRSDKDRTT